MVMTVVVNKDSPRSLYFRVNVSSEPEALTLPLTTWDLGPWISYLPITMIKIMRQEQLKAWGSVAHSSRLRSIIGSRSLR